MLFRTVYGPELEAIYGYVATCNAGGIQPTRMNIHAAFMMCTPDDDLPSTQSVDDALAFLQSARLVERDDGYRACDTRLNIPFAVQLLQALRRIEKGEEPPDHPLDGLYTYLLTEIFIRPDRLYVKDLHTDANQLQAVQNVGGLGREKIGAWKRVMAFLGVGRRVAGGFQCIYEPSLVRSILSQWDRETGTLQSFLEDCFDQTLPYAQADGALAQAASGPLLHLARRGRIDLFPLQDSPTRSYFGRRRYKGMTWKENTDESL